MLKDKRIVFVVSGKRIYDDQIFSSQVLNLARYVARQGASCLIFNFIEAPLGQSEWVDDAVKGVRVLYAGMGAGKCNLLRVVDNLRRVMAAYRKELADFRPTHFYVRSYMTCLAVRDMSSTLGAKLVYSMRGADYEENLVERSLRSWLRVLIVAWMIRRTLKVCDHVNFVSKKLADRFRSRTNGKRTSVLPCCVGQEQAELQRDLKCNENKTLIYSGGIYSWQNFDEILLLMKRVHECDPTIQIRFLTRWVDDLRRKCEDVGFKDDEWEVRSCRYDEVAAELEKADVGIILRKDEVINNVASPIKIGEYLAAGLGVIVSPWIGDVGDMLKGKSFAKLYRAGDAVEDVVRFVNEMSAEKRREAQKFACEYYTYGGNESVIKEMFA